MRALNAIAEAPELPEPGDVSVLIPPVLRAWARYVRGAGLWICFEATGRTVSARAVFRELP